jgi:hypothetical protein
VNLAGDHLNAIHFRTGRKTARQLEHIGGLASCICITPQLEIMATKQAMQMQMKEVKTHLNFRRLAHL